MKKKHFSKSSKIWLNNHFNDIYVKKRNIKKIRSRAWFKLESLDKKEKIFKSGMNVIDLGSSPGSWSQYAFSKVGILGNIIACDLKPMINIKGVNFILGDITQNNIFNKFISLSKHIVWNVIMSDMSPNISGISIIDSERSFYLADIALRISEKISFRKDFFIVKLFQGNGFNQYLKKISNIFKKVKIRKPNASRSSSREVFLVASGHKNK